MDGNSLPALMNFVARFGVRRRSVRGALGSRTLALLRAVSMYAMLLVIYTIVLRAGPLPHRIHEQRDCTCILYRFTYICTPVRAFPVSVGRLLSGVYWGSPLKVLSLICT